MIKRKPLLIFLSLFAPLFANANICGTDYQNFNPTVNGLDFVTVQSSETLKPCLLNMGFFLNYAKDSLTYSKTLNADFEKGQKGKDETWAADLSVGMGLTDHWDIGFSIPAVLKQNVANDYYVSSYEETGVTEVKLYSKYNLFGDESGGLAAVVSMNKNLIENNPFTGRNAGPTWNLELAADTTFASKWATAVNLGYRWRQKGEPIPDVPFVPMGNQWTYSVAASYLVASLDTKVIGEIYGSRAAEQVDQDTDRSMNSLEGLIGLKHDSTTNMAFHFGAATQLDSSLGGPAFRVYAGANWAIDLGCEEKPAVAVVEKQTLQAPPDREVSMQVIVLPFEMLFASDSDELDTDGLAAADGALKEVFTQGFEGLAIEGHTDSVGPEEYNMELSQRRANRVKEMLVQKYSLPAAKIQATGFGETQPIADNGNFQGRRKNRRVALKISRLKKD